MSNVPRVGIGMPVYNGEKHIALSLDSILTQTHENFELIISDNASTDRTEEICREYAAKDERIRYFRNAENLGAARNYNRVFELFSGEPGTYFRWNAHDDLIAPTNLEKCVQALRAAPSAVLAFPRRRYITWEEGRIIGSAYECVTGASTEDGLTPGRPTNQIASFANIDFAAVLRLYGGWFPVFAFALYPTEAVRKTNLLGAFPGADRILVAEFAMLGDFVEVPEDLYLQRLHPGSIWTLRKTEEEEAQWFDPRSRAPKFPKMSIYFQYLKAVHRAPIAERKKFARYGDLLARIGEAGVNGMRRKVGLKSAGAYSRLAPHVPMEGDTGQDK